jgi:g-D-glutamyl-meso-diaminopimelate peptidase
MVTYGYNELIRDLIAVDNFKKFMKISVIGNSILGKKIFMVEASSRNFSKVGKKNVLIISGHHSLETITSEFTIKYLLNSKEEDFANANLFVVPLLNPDGAEIVSDRTNKNSRIWQANANGVDLNHNYDAGFYIAKEEVEKEGIKGPTPTKYGGEYPFSESETKAIMELCEKTSFDVAIAFHTQGGEIYYGYDGIIPEDTYMYLENFEKVSGYKPSHPTGTASHAGFKDWFVLTYKKPAFTIEAGYGKNPLNHSQFDGIYKSCSRIIDICIEKNV